MQVFDSNGPDVRIRGTAYQVHEKYMALAKDAGSAGDRILAENYLQHAEHYQRLINSWALEDGYTPPAEQDIGESDQPQQQAESEDHPQQQAPRREGFDPSRRRRHPYQQRPQQHAVRHGGNGGQQDDLGLPASILGARPVASPAQDQNARKDEMAES